MTRRWLGNWPIANGRNRVLGDIDLIAESECFVLKHAHSYAGRIIKPQPLFINIRPNTLLGIRWRNGLARVVHGRAVSSD